MSIDRKPLGALAVIAVAAVLVSAIALEVGVDAARGGKGHGKWSGSIPVLTITPSQVPLGSASVTINGTEFPANEDIIINASMGPQPRLTTDGTGSFSIVYSPTSGFTYPGPASVQALRSSDLAVLATALYTVCSSDPCP